MYVPELQKTSYLVCFGLPYDYEKQVRQLMHTVAQITGVTPPCEKLNPHMSIYRPATGVDEHALMNLLTNEVKQAQRPTVTTGRKLNRFGKEYLVIPVEPALGAAMLWVGISKRLSHLHGCEPDKYTFDNKLHISVADGISSVSDETWPRIKEIEIEPMVIQIETVAVYRKAGEGRWRLLSELTIPTHN